MSQHQIKNERRTSSQIVNKSQVSTPEEQVITPDREKEPSPEKQEAQPGFFNRIGKIGDMLWFAKKTEGVVEDSKSQAGDQLQIELNEINTRLTCECKKDHHYKFACVNGIKWFMTESLECKIRKRLKQDAKLDVSTVINDEY